MAHFNFVISQNAKWGHAGFYIDCHRMTVPENIFLQKKHCVQYRCQQYNTGVTDVAVYNTGVSKTIQVSLMFVIVNNAGVSKTIQVSLMFVTVNNAGVSKTLAPLTSSHVSPASVTSPTGAAATAVEGVELLHVDWVQELPEDLDVCIAQRDFEAAVDLIQKSNCSLPVATFGRIYDLIAGD